MNVLKKAGLLAALVVFGLLSVFVYLNSHFYYKSLGKDGTEKIEFLERSNKYCPLNDVVFYELGKSYFDLGLANLNDPGTAESHFRKSVQSLRKSIVINPASPFGHFYLGQALLHLGLYAPGEDSGLREEFRKAALLAGEDSRIFGEVGRLFLSRWPELSEEDRDFTVAILRRTMARRDSEKIALLMSLWELNVGDYKVMDEILPADSRVYRQYARFLGEKALSLEERQKYLARAEKLEFERAKREYQAGEAKLIRFQTKEAFGHFRTSLDLLKGIRFYQTLAAQNLISNGEFRELLKSTLLNIAKCRIEERAGLSEVESYLRQYLALEDQPARITELETYLRDRGVLLARFERNFEDLDRLAFELLLFFKENRYREIINFGRELGTSFVVVPEAKKRDYIRVLHLVGDSFQKVDFLYDAGDLYEKALAINPTSIETLVRTRQNYERLNDERKKAEVNRAIEKIMTSKEIDFRNMVINRGTVFPLAMVLDGQKIALDLRFGKNDQGDLPLVAVFFNGRVVREEPVEGGLISLSLETKVGENKVEILPVSRPASLARLVYRISNDDKTLPIFGPKLDRTVSSRAKR